MRILAVYWGHSGAGPRILESIAHELAEMPHIQSFISFSSEADIADSLRLLPLQQLEVHTPTSIPKLMRYLPRLITNAIKLRRFVQQNQITHVISVMHSISLSPFLWLALPHDVHYCTSLHDAWPNPAQGVTLGTVAEKFCVQKEVSRANSAIVYSKSVMVQAQQRWKQSLPPTIRLNHGAFATVSQENQAVRTINPKNRIRIGIVGRLTKYKGLDIFCQISKQLSGNRYIFVAAGKLDPTLKNLEYEYPNVDWHTGWLTEIELDRIVDSLDIIVLPYPQASQSGVFALALAHAVPCVVTPVGGIQEQAQQSGAGIVANGISSEAIARAIDTLSSDPARYQKLSSAAIQAAAGSMSWRNSVTSLLEFLTTQSRQEYSLIKRKRDL